MYTKYLKWNGSKPPSSLKGLKQKKSQPGIQKNVLRSPIQTAHSASLKRGDDAINSTVSWIEGPDLECYAKLVLKEGGNQPKSAIAASDILYRSLTSASIELEKSKPRSVTSPTKEAPPIPLKRSRTAPNSDEILGPDQDIAECVNFCGKQMISSQIGRHLQHDCCRRIVTCNAPGCGEQLEQRDLQRHMVSHSPLPYIF